MKLDTFLHSSACGREAMGLSRAHGFLTAAASGPEQLETAEWLRLVFDEPVFENGEQAEDMLELAMRLYREIESGLGEPGGFRPVLEYLRDERGGTAVDATAWCMGYFTGMSLCREDWAIHCGGALAVLLAPLREISRRRGPGRDAGYRRLCDQLPGAAEAIYRYWRAQEADQGA